MTPSSRDIEQISRSQSRQQILLIILCIAVAACAAAMWRVGSAMREANEVQKVLLAQEADAPRKPEKRRASARAATTRASTGAQRSPNRREQEGGGGRQAVADSTAGMDLTGTQVVLVRQGRQ